jgi:signal transduction histidine kinase
MNKYSLILKIKLHARLIILLCTALLATIVAGFYFTRYLIKPNTGLVMNYMEVIYDDGSIVFSPRTPFSPAVSAGLIPNKDVILKINNRSIKTIRDVLDVNSQIWNFDPLPVHILREGNQKIKLYITPELNLLRADWIVTLYFLCVLCFMAYYLIINHRQETYNIIAIIVTLFFALFICVQPFYFENLITMSLIYFGEIVSWLLVVFALYFPKPKFHKYFRRGFIITVGLLYAVYIIFRTEAFIQWTQNRSDEYYNKVIFFGQIQNISDLFAYVLFLGFIIHTYLKTAQEHIKKHIEWIAAGAFIAIPTYVFFDQIPYIMGEMPGLRLGMGSFANFFLSFLPLFYLIGLLRSHKLNLQVLNKRSIISLFLALILLAIFAFLYQPFKDIFVENFGAPPDIAGFMVSLALFITLFLFYAFSFWVIEKYFFKRFTPVNKTTAVNVIEPEDPSYLKNLFSFQKEKITEMRILLKGIDTKLSKSIRSINSSLLTLARGIKKISVGAIASSYQNESELKQIIEKALNNVRQGSLTINDFSKKLLSLLGQEAGIPISIDINTIISSACEQVKVRIPDINVKVINNTQVKLFCYPEEIILILILLFENSYEALLSKSSQIDIETFSTPKYVYIEIKDKGMGISEKTIDKIFNPFFTTKRGHDGLGLFFCRLLIEKNWGRIEVRSVQNKQTKVCLYLSQQQAE